MFAIEAAGLHKLYAGPFGRGGQKALNGVELTVSPGTAFGLIGQNGAGKTTFIKILLGVVRPTSGTVQVLGGDPEDARIRARIGYLPERLHLPDSAKPMTFLRSVARLKRLAPSSSELETLIGRVGLGDAVGRKIGGYSKGMRQRLGLAAALLGAPELLVLDEPTDGIDPLGRVEIRRLLQEELSRGATLFLNSHLLAETERICGRIAILAAGRVVREGALDELRRAGFSWRARFASGFDASALTAAGFIATSRPDLWQFTAEDPAGLNAALDRARASGALLVALEPLEKDLEQVLADALGVAA